MAENGNHFGTFIGTSFAYDAFGIAATSITNEREQTTTTETDLGTGQTLKVQGPNILECNPSERAGSRTEYDAMARPIAVYEIGCHGGSYSDSRLLSSAQYVDFDLGVGIPAHVITTSYQEEGGPGIESRVYVDGAGRTLRSVVNDGTTDGIVSTSEYNAKGQLIRSTMPNPSTTSQPGDIVDSSYSYDSLGRTVAVRQAPAIDGANATGVNIEYSFDGTLAIQEVSEHVMSGPAATTTTYSDFFGRMVQVDESRDGATAAQTRYEYDGNDNVKKITDADGIVTEMEHDWDSRRTKVIRGEREWTYAYDKNGNMIRETSPNDVGETADDPGFVYTTQTIYDDLDRPTSRILATAGHDSATLDTFDAREVGFTYDSCANGIGQLCMVTTGANLTTNYVYDYAGRVTSEHQDIELPVSVADFAPESRVTYMSYNLAGAITDAWLADGSSLATSTHMSYSFDALGSPQTMTYHAPGGDMVASVVRNQAQRITQQTLGCLTRSWDFDHKGRVTDTMVESSGCSVQQGVILSEHVEYGDSSEVDVHNVFRAGLSDHNFTYAYDDQHQLVGASNGRTGAAGYNVAFSYTGAGRLLKVNGYEGAPIVGRGAMSYVGGYGDGTLLGGDEHAPVDLLGDVDVHYDYDFSGNATRRQEVDGGTTTWDFSYDGTNQQREVVLADGSGDRELYYYDHSGSRYMAVTYGSSATVPDRIRVWIGGAEIWYVPDGSGAMVVDTEYAHLSLGGITIGRVKTEAAMGVKTAEASFHNGLGHLMGAVDWETGVVNAAFVYGPYGEVLESVGGETADHLRRFNGKESDQLSRLSYYGYRYYDELSLSWTQADPLFVFIPDLTQETPRAMTLYAFSMNNPVRYVDPDGLQAQSPSMQVAPSGGTTVEVGCMDGTTDCLSEAQKNAAFEADARATWRHMDAAAKDHDARRPKKVVMRHQRVFVAGVEGLQSHDLQMQAVASIGRQCGWKCAAGWVGLNAAVVAVPVGLAVLGRVGVWWAARGAAAAPAAAGLVSTAVPAQRFVANNSSLIGVAFKNGTVRLFLPTSSVNHIKILKDTGALVGGKLSEGAAAITVVKDAAGVIFVTGSRNVGGTLAIPEWARQLALRYVR